MPLNDVTNRLGVHVINLRIQNWTLRDSKAKFMIYGYSIWNNYTLDPTGEIRPEPIKCKYFLSVPIYIYLLLMSSCVRNIIEQSIEWNALLCFGFIHFKKVVDNIHHSTLGKILRHYGLPQKIVHLISILYQNFECSVLMEINQTNSFSVWSGVWQGCILSTILFNIALDYIMRHTIQNAQVLTENVRKTGLQINQENTRDHLGIMEEACRDPCEIRRQCQIICEFFQHIKQPLTIRCLQ